MKDYHETQFSVSDQPGKTDEQAVAAVDQVDIAKDGLGLILQRYNEQERNLSWYKWPTNAS